MLKAWAKGRGISEYQEHVEKWAHEMVDSEQWRQAEANEEVAESETMLTQMVKNVLKTHVPES